MAKKPLFPVDRSVFSEEATIKPPQRRKKKITLEELLLAAKDLGLEVRLPTSADEAEKQEASLERLGFTESKKQKVKEIPSTKLIGYLHGRHRVGGEVYGPGSLELDSTQKDLFNSLLKQDQLAIQSLMDSSEYSGGQRSYLITLGKGQDRNHKYSKVEVADLNYAMALATPINHIR